MNSIERVRAALHFSGPDRVPVINMMNAWSVIMECDILPASVLTPKTWQPGWRESEVGLFPHPLVPFLYKWKRPPWARNPQYRHWQDQTHEEIDDWGCVWTVPGDHSSMGHPSRPALLDWSQLDKHVETYFLDPTDRKRYSTNIWMHKLAGRRRYRMFFIGGFGPFTVADNLRGFNQFLVDHRRHPNQVKDLLNRVTENLATQVKMFKKYGGDPHGVFLYEDLGTQDRPFLNPRMFKEFYEPVYRTLFDAAHDIKCEFHLHCCGKIDPLLPDLIEWGLDALELDSPRMCGYQDLKPFRGKLMFWGCVNIQSIYVNGTPAECEREVWHMMRNLGTPSGGFGAYLYPQFRHIKAPTANIRAFKEGLKKFGTYANVPSQWWETPVPEIWQENNEDIVPPLPSLNSRG